MPLDTIVIFDPAPGPATGLSVTRLPGQTSGTGTSSLSFTFDLSGASSGDRLVAWYVNARTDSPTAFNYNTSNSMTKVVAASPNAGNSGRWIHCYEYVLGSDGGVSDTIDITLVGNSNIHIIYFAYTNGVISDSDSAGGQNSTQTTSVTVSDAANEILAVATGESSITDWDAFTGATEQESLTQTYITAISTASDVSTGAYAVEANPTVGSGDLALSTVLIEAA